MALLYILLTFLDSTVKVIHDFHWTFPLEFKDFGKMLSTIHLDLEFNDPNLHLESNDIESNYFSGFALLTTNFFIQSLTLHITSIERP